MKSLLFTGTLALLLAACSAPSPQQLAEADANVCTTETPTGTHMPKRMCKTVAQREQERRAAEEGLADMRGSKPLPQGR